MVIALLGLLACDPPADDDKDLVPGDDSAAALPDPATVALNGLCPADTHWGAFTVASTVDYAYVSGAVADAVVPVTVPTVLGTFGDCTLYRRENPFCDPPSTSEPTCDLTGACVPYPTALDLGPATIDGLVQPVEMIAAEPGYTYFDTSLPNPPWTAGDTLGLFTSGDSPLSLYAVAPAALTLGEVDWVLTAGAPFTLTWDAPASAVRTTVQVTLSVDQHGVTPARLECSFADTGTATLPAEAVAALLDRGVTGFPAGAAQRLSASHAAFGDGGCVDLLASVPRLAHVAITGYTPCTQDSDCPDGLACNETLERCE